VIVLVSLLPAPGKYSTNMDTQQEKIVGQAQIGIVTSRMHQLMAPVRKVIALRRLENTVCENSLDSVSFTKENKRLNRSD
jgi:hypothetical protein